jgi:hypothetical protein
MKRTVRSTRERLRRALGTVGLAIVAVSVSLGEGTPLALPGVALGSPVLLHAERALALVAIVIAALSVLAQAARGRLPIELSTSRAPLRSRSRRRRGRRRRSTAGPARRPGGNRRCPRRPTRRPATTPLTCEYRDGFPADDRTTAAGLGPRTGQGDAGTQRAPPRRGPASRCFAPADRRAAPRRQSVAASESPVAGTRRWSACGWCPVLPDSRSTARIGGRQALPCGSLRES